MTSLRRGMALGLFHFNVQYVAGSALTSHRYCVQAVIPFFQFLDQHPHYRVSVEMAGCSLEFLAKNYPKALLLLRLLVERNQVELISATYAPTVWVAFPLRDLVQSIRLNRSLLKRLALKSANIFFSQEAFFGPGLQAVSDWFSVALCKDDYLRYMTGLTKLCPVYQLGNLRVLVGANHLANEAARRLVATTEIAPAKSSLSSFYRERIEKGRKAIPMSAPEIVSGTSPTTDWYWYHLGNGHHFTTWAQPDEREVFFADQRWMSLNAGILDDLHAEGYVSSFLTEFIKQISQEEIPSLPSVLEGSWNPSQSDGVYTWMGRHSHPWENDSGILGLAWRSRFALRQCEKIHAASLQEKPDLRDSSKLKKIWKRQIRAESSDPLGWQPLQEEVKYGLASPERVLRLTSEFLLEKNATSKFPKDFLQGIYTQSVEDESIETEITPLTEGVGAESKTEWRTIRPHLAICEITFRMTEGNCGVRFQRDRDFLAYCPSGLENLPSEIDLHRFAPAIVYLPLANGFISLGRKQHLIRVNQFGQVAARIAKDNCWAEFTIQGPPNGKLYRWQFIFFRGGMQEAVRIANAVNYV